MARFILVALLAAALAPGAAHAQSKMPDEPRPPSVAANAELAARLEARAAKVSAKAQADAQAKLDRIAKRIDDNAEKAGDATVAARLAAEFGTTAKAMLDANADASWGSLVIAHTLAANAQGVTAHALVDLNRQGMSWATMAAGLGFPAPLVTSAVAAEANVAAGIARADGRVQGIASGAQAGALVQGATGAAANAGVQSAVSAAGATVNAGSSLGLGIGR